MGAHESNRLSERAGTVRFPDRVRNRNGRLGSPCLVRGHNRWRSVPSTLAQNPRVFHEGENWLSSSSASLNTGKDRPEGGLALG